MPPLAILQRERENLFLPIYPYPLLLVVAASCSTQTLAAAPPCGCRRFLSAMPSDPEIEALRQCIDALIKDADAAEAKAVIACRRAHASRLLLEEE
jgi:hypothetical protein